MPGVWNFAFLRFSYIKQAAPNKAWTLRCSLGGTQTLNKSINNTQIPFQKLLRHPPHISRDDRTLKDTARHQKTPINTSKCHSMSTWAATHRWTAFLGALDRLLVSSGVCWFLLVSDVVLNRPELPGGGDCEHMGEVNVSLWGLNVCKGVLDCSGLVWCNKCSILEMYQKAKLHAPGTFKTSKYQNLPI